MDKSPLGVGPLVTLTFWLLILASIVQAADWDEKLPELSVQRSFWTSFQSLPLLNGAVPDSSEGADEETERGGSVAGHSPASSPPSDQDMLQEAYFRALGPGPGTGPGQSSSRTQGAVVASSVPDGLDVDVSTDGKLTSGADSRNHDGSSRERTEERTLTHGAGLSLRPAQPQEGAAAAEKRSTRGISAQLASGYADSTDSDPIAAKGLLGGVAAYRSRGQNIQLKEQPALIVEDKRFLKGVNSYLRGWKSLTPDNPAAPGTTDKRFLKGVNGYLRGWKTLTQDNSAAPSTEVKRFMRGVNVYLSRVPAAWQPEQYQKGSRGDITDDLIDDLLDADLEDLNHAPGRRETEEVYANNPFSTNIDQKELAASAHQEVTPESWQSVARSPVVGVASNNASEAADSVGLKLYGYSSSDRSETATKSQPYAREGPSQHADKHEKGKITPDGLDNLHIFTLPHRPPERVKRSSTTTDQREDDDDNESTLHNVRPYKRFFKGVNPYLQYALAVPGLKRLPVLKARQTTKRSIRFPETIEKEVYYKLTAEPESDHDNIAVRPAQQSDLMPNVDLPYSDVNNVGESEKDPMAELPDYYDADVENGDIDVRENGDIDVRENGDIDVIENADNDVIEKRFMRGLNPYLQTYLSSRPYKRLTKDASTDVLPILPRPRPKNRPFFPYPAQTKRFFKGVNPFLRHYAVVSGFASDDLGSYGSDTRFPVKKRFLKGVNDYLRKFSSGFHDSGRGDGRVYEGAISKRFLRGINPHLYNYLARPWNKRLLADESDFDEITSNDDDQIIDDMEKTVANEGSVSKRFFKGINPYLLYYADHQSYDKRHGRRAQREFVKELDTYLKAHSKHLRDKRNADKRFMKNLNPYLQRYRHSRTGPPTSKRFREGLNVDFENYGRNQKMDKRFMKAANPYLRTYAHIHNSNPDGKRFMKGAAVDSYLRKFPQRQKQATSASEQDLVMVQGQKVKRSVSSETDLSNVLTSWRLTRSVDQYVHNRYDFDDSQQEGQVGSQTGTKGDNVNGGGATAADGTYQSPRLHESDQGGSKAENDIVRSFGQLASPEPLTALRV